MQRLMIFVAMVCAIIGIGFYLSLTELEGLDEEIAKAAVIAGRFEQEFELTKNPLTNEVPRQKLLKAWNFISQKITQKSTLNVEWVERGPNNVGGRTRAFLIDANDPSGKTVWSGGVSGGLWKTTDISAATPNWMKVNDVIDNLALTAIAQHPSSPNILYFGTGEGWQNADAVRGLGIFKSTDGGLNWAQIPATNNSDFYYIQKLIVDTAGNIFAATHSGLMISPDNGASWTQILGSSIGLGSTDLAADIEISANGDLFATLGINSTGSIWKSTFSINGINTGMSGTWIDISPPGTYRRTEIALALSNQNTLYAICQSNTSGEIKYFYQSSDAGNTWISKNLAAWGNQTWYNLILAIDPNDENRIHAGGTPAFISKNGGNTWSLSYFGVHVDFHNIQFINGSSSEMICSNDGGIYYSTNGQTDSPTFQNKSKGYNITQFYSCAVHPDKDNPLFIAGSQDNGTQKVAGMGIQAGTILTSGDGGFCHIDENNPNFMFSSFFQNNLNRSTDGGNTFSNVLTENSGNFINPSDYDNDAKKLYAGNSNGSYFRWNDSQTGTSFDNVAVTSFNGANITHVLVSPNLPNRVYFGLNNGSIVFVDNSHIGTNQLGKIIKTGSGSVSGIAIEAGNEDHILVTYSNYGTVSVWETNDATNSTPTWKDVEGDLPNMPVRWCLFSPRSKFQAIIATELGVWTTDDLSVNPVSWNPSNSGLANVRVDMLQFRSSDSLLLAATHGRGLFSTNYFSKLTVGFKTASTEIAENSATLIQNTCEEYQEIQIPIEISRTPITDITFDIMVKMDSDATANRDFILETTSLTFSTIDPLEKNITLKVFEDFYSETDEQIILEISPNASALFADIFEHSIIIQDNDPDPIMGSIEETKTIGNGNYTFAFAPFRGISQDEKAEFILRRTDFTNHNLEAGEIKAIAFEVMSKGSAYPYNDFTISMQNSLKDAADNEFEVGMTTVFNENLSTIAGWNTLNFDTPFNWDGTSNLIFQTCFNNELSSSNDIVSANAPGYNSTEFNFQNENVGCNLAAPVGAFILRPNLQLTIKQPIKVCEEVGISESFWLKAEETAHFYDANNKIIGSIKQTGVGEIGCVHIGVSTQGTGQSTAAWLTGQITDKTFIIETDNEITYELTLYFSAAELAIWGASALNLNILKSTTSIDESTAQNSEIYSNNLLNTAAYGSANNVYYTGTFTGDAGFALTNSAPTILPLELIDFRGEKEPDSINLFWETSFEEDIDFFSIEKSDQGDNFQNIADINAKGFSNNTQSYTYLDQSPFLGKNYYRLKSTNFSGLEEIHKTILIEYANNFETDFWVYPSLLLAETIHLDFTATTSGNANFSIFNTTGRNLFMNRITTIEGKNSHSFSNLQLSSGLYIVILEISGKVYSQKIYKENN